MARGKFIVIEGTDGSGKTSQHKLLVERLKKEGNNVAVFDFPQYFKASSEFVKGYLQGRYGSLDEVSPQKASLLFAMDRFEASPEIKQALREGKIVVANRYVGSNMGHQGAKFSIAEDRRNFFDWIKDLEYGVLEIPQPDLNIVLHVPAEIAQTLVDKKSIEKREYVNGKKRDLHEENLEHLKHAEQVYLELVKLYPDQFTLVECMASGQLMSIPEVHEKIWAFVQEKIKEPTGEPKPLF